MEIKLLFDNPLNILERSKKKGFILSKNTGNGKTKKNILIRIENDYSILLEIDVFCYYDIVDIPLCNIKETIYKDGNIISADYLFTKKCKDLMCGYYYYFEGSLFTVNEKECMCVRVEFHVGNLDEYSGFVITMKKS